MLKSAFLFGIALLLVQALVKNFLPAIDWYGLVPGVIVGSAYALLNRKPMLRSAKLKALLVFIVIAGLAAFGVGIDHIGEYEAGLALSVSAVLTLIYALSAYLGLSLGSFFSLRLSGHTPWGHATLPPMKNSYVLGALLLVSEILINLAYRALTGSDGNLGGIGIVLAMTAGQVYTSWHKVKMPSVERFKTLGVYFLAMIVIGTLAFWETFSANPGLAVIIAGVVFLIYGALMYAAMGWGSSLTVKALEKQAAKAAEAPSQA